MSGVGAVLALRKMPAAAIGEPEELVVTLAEDQHGGPGRSGVVHQLTHARDQRVVVRPCPPGMRRPWHLPLLLPPLPIGMEQGAILTGLRPAVLSTPGRSDGRTHPRRTRRGTPRPGRASTDRHLRRVRSWKRVSSGPVVVPHRAPQRGTEHRGGTDVERLTSAAARVITAQTARAHRRCDTARRFRPRCRRGSWLPRRDRSVHRRGARPAGPASRRSEWCRC